MQIWETVWEAAFDNISLCFKLEGVGERRAVKTGEDNMVAIHNEPQKHQYKSRIAPLKVIEITVFTKEFWNPEDQYWTLYLAFNLVAFGTAVMLGTIHKWKIRNQFTTKIKLSISVS